MVMDRETSHHQACTSHETDCSIFKKSSHYTHVEHVSPRTTRIEVKFDLLHHFVYLVVITRTKYFVFLIQQKVESFL